MTRTRRAAIALWLAANVVVSVHLVQLARLAQRETHRTNVIVECATKITVVIPATEPERRQDEFKKCIALEGIKYEEVQ
jgi:hypothetical protein